MRGLAGTPRRYFWRRGARVAEILIEPMANGRFRVTVDGRVEDVDCAALGDGRLSTLQLSTARQLAGRVAAAADAVAVRAGGLEVRVDLVDPWVDASGAPGASKRASSEIRTPIPGRVVEVRVREGEIIEAGATLLIIEAMKMQNEIRAEARARISRLACSAGQSVEAGALLIELGEAGSQE
jgi:biotin carboxyl carrier protein